MEMPHEKTVRHAKSKIIVRKKKPDGTVRRRKNTKKNRARTAEIHAKQQQALQMRMTGMTYMEIARALGYANPSSAKAAVDGAIWRAEKDAAKEVVALDLARLDEYQMRCTHALRTNGDLHQIDRLMRIMEMRYRLLGITDETVRQLQSEHGITINNKNMVMNIHAAPETEDEFIKKMMRAVGVDPNTKEAKNLLSEHSVPLALPMLEGSANESSSYGQNDAEAIDEEDIVEAEIVEEL